ncbi:MAG: DUF6677 family protein [Acidobacteriota bacterium]
MSDAAAAETARGESGLGPRTILSMVLAWLLPGAGHLYLGRPRRAALYLGIVMLMFFVGLQLDGTLSRPVQGRYLSYLAALADMGVGPLYWVSQAMGWGLGRVTAATHELGNAFHWTAGLLNMLLVLDAHDIAQGRK